MGERRVSGWFILSAVFVVLVFGLFFTFTERKTWPEHRLELGPMDMRLVPPLSTLWCEAVALHSDRSFVAYQVNHSGQINPLRLASQNVKLERKKFGRSWNTNYEDFKYFLLPSSVIDIIGCSSHPGMKLLIFKGEVNVLDCLQSLHKGLQNGVIYEDFGMLHRKKIYSVSSEEDYSDYSSSEEDYDDISEETSIQILKSYQKACSSLLRYEPLDLVDVEGFTDCSPWTLLRPVKMNVSSADHYVIVVWNSNQNKTNYVNLRVMLDRTRYLVQKSGQALDICSLSNSCIIGLNFASGDRVLVTVPEEKNAERSTVVVRSRCKPRLAVFAVLSVLLPLLLFLAVAFVVRADRQAFGKFFCKKLRSNSRRPNGHRVAAPLLDNRNAGSLETFPVPEGHSVLATVQIDDMPPPYHTLYDPPPPYACVKDKTKNCCRNS